MRIIGAGILLSLYGIQPAFAAVDPVAYVDPLIGTARDGAVNPGASTPFGMVQWTPVTPHSPIGSYQYEDSQIAGMSLTHLSGTGCPNADEISVLPTVGPNNSATGIPFRHSDEVATPGYYRVVLGNQVTTELTATTRTGFARYTFPRTRDANLLIDASQDALGPIPGGLTSIGPREISGWSRGGHFCGSNAEYTVYFVIQADRDLRITSLGAAKWLATVDARQQNRILLKIGISYVSIENAKAGLSAENPAWQFDRTSARAAEQWRRRLSAIRIGEASTARLKVFYTALYHSLLHPNVFNDVNGDYLGFDGKVRNSARPHYANFSGWDVYRSQLQLVAWLFPDVGSDIAQSLVDDAAQCGALPKWAQNNVDAGVMVGDPGVAEVAALYAFGGRNFDTSAALQYMRRSGMQAGTRCNDVPIRPGLEPYLGIGYVPPSVGGVWGDVSTTLEYAIADFTIAAFARQIGDTITQAAFASRADFWRHLYHPETGLLQAKDDSGAFVTGVTDTTTDGYVEGSALQYLWSVPQNMRGLIDALGGDAKAIARLDPFVGQLNAGAAAPHLYIGNEPGFWAPWFYLWAHAPARAQDVVRRIVDTCFLPTPDGLPGNDDLGATSSWLVWASLGLFPAVPGVSGLAIASPEFRHIEIMAGTGRKMTIEAPAAPARYVQGLTVDGLPTSHPWLGEQRVRSGGSLAFHLTDQPSDWGSGADAVPDSFLGETAAPDRPGEPYRAGLSPSSWEPGPRTSSP